MFNSNQSVLLSFSYNSLYSPLLSTVQWLLVSRGSEEHITLESHRKKNLVKCHSKKFNTGSAFWEILPPWATKVVNTNSE